MYHLILVTIMRGLSSALILILVLGSLHAQVVPLEIEGNGDQILKIKTLNQQNSGVDLLQNIVTRPNYRIWLSGADGDLHFDVNRVDHFATPGTTLFRVTNDSMVAIGSHDPLAKLHILNGLEANLSKHGFLMLGSDTGPNLVFDSDEIVARNNGVGSSLLIQPHGGNSLLQPAGGNVGIGLTMSSIPDARLQVVNGEQVGPGTDGLMMLFDKFFQFCQRHQSVFVIKDIIRPGS